MDVTETIRTFLEFFVDRGHQVVPGSSPELVTGAEE